MTGFGRSQFQVDGVRYSVEIRSVNHRYLDFKARLPRALAALEPALKRRISERLARGRVDCIVSGGADDSESGGRVEVNWPLAESVHVAFDALAQRFALPSPDVAALAGWPGVLRGVPQEIDDDAVAAALMPAVDAALDTLVEMRAAEGGALAEVLGGHLDVVGGLAATLASHAPEQSAAYRARLESRLGEMLGALELSADPGRVLHEVGVFAEKSDVAEELARLEAHVAQARALIESPPADGVGRRLDFLCQEMFREANTVASKVADLKLSELAIDAKVELERLREQVQNVE